MRARIRRNSIPPKWRRVQIAESSTDHLQVVGVDASGKRQYIYHPLWKELAKSEKYLRLERFSGRFREMMARVNRVLGHGGAGGAPDGAPDGADRAPNGALDREYVICAVVKFLELTGSRIGNVGNKNYGLTTLLKSHVRVDGADIRVRFVGKRGVVQDYHVRDAQLSGVTRRLLGVPGAELFKTSTGTLVTSKDVNAYIKEVMGPEHTAKDFRTFLCNQMLFNLLSAESPAGRKDPAELTRVLNARIAEVAAHIGHSPAIAKSSYISPVLTGEFLVNGGRFSRKTRSMFMDDAGGSQRS